MRVLTYDPDRRVYLIDKLGGYAHPAGGSGRRAYVAVAENGEWSMAAKSRDDLDMALWWLLEFEALPMTQWSISAPHGRLSKRGYDYIHAPSRTVIRRTLEPWPNGKGNTVIWSSTIAGVEVDWGKLSNARGLFRALAELNP